MGIGHWELGFGWAPWFVCRCCRAGRPFAAAPSSRSRQIGRLFPSLSVALLVVAVAVVVRARIVLLRVPLRRGRSLRAVAERVAIVCDCLFCFALLLRVAAGARAGLSGAPEGRLRELWWRWRVRLSEARRDAAAVTAACGDGPPDGTAARRRLPPGGCARCCPLACLAPVLDRARPPARSWWS